VCSIADGFDSEDNELFVLRFAEMFGGLIYAMRRDGAGGPDKETLIVVRIIFGITRLMPLQRERISIKEKATTSRDPKHFQMRPWRRNILSVPNRPYH
jgi:hypothetical protein